MKIMAGEQETFTSPVVGENIEYEARMEPRLLRAGKLCGKLALLGSVMAGSAAYGVFHEPVETQIGPHEATVDLTLDSAATFDLGPIGSIIKPLDGTNGVGAHIRLGEVPMRPNGINAESYARSLANFEGDMANIKDDLSGQGIRYGLYGGVATTGAYMLLGKRRRQELAERMAKPGIKAGLAAVSTVGLMGATLAATGSVSSAEAASVPVDGIFENTPLEGARVTGEFLPHIVNTYGREIIDRWQNNDLFYDQAVQNARTAYEANYRLQPREGYPIMLFYTDLHCNVGMARVIGEVARLAEADLIADGGDTTMSGTSYEKFCIQVLDNELPNIPRIVAGGNHDSHETEAQYRRFGFTPLDGEAYTAAGLTFIGDDDVMRSAFGTGIVRERQETAEQMGQRLAESACSTEANILLVHDPDVAEPFAAKPCVSTILSGHMHKESITQIPDEDGNTLLYLTGDNASGARKQQPTLGPVEDQARLYLIKFNGQTGRPLFYQTLTVLPDASTVLSGVVTVPQAPILPAK